MSPPGVCLHIYAMRVWTACAAACAQRFAAKVAFLIQNIVVEMVIGTMEQLKTNVPP